MWCPPNRGPTSLRALAALLLILSLGCSGVVGGQGFAYANGESDAVIEHCAEVIEELDGDGRVVRRTKRDCETTEVIGGKGSEGVWQAMAAVLSVVASVWTVAN